MARTAVVTRCAPVPPGIDHNGELRDEFGRRFHYPHPSHISSTLPLVAELSEHQCPDAKSRLRFHIS